jgi:exopolyphosphatase/guanosine-5'-triphosphate,3'-diphosphate pyrophosphatase
MANTAMELRRDHAKPVAGTSLRVGAIDIGSNSIHMIVADAGAEGDITPIFRLKEMVGLGRATFPSKAFSKETIEQAITAMAKFHRAAIHHGCEKVVAVATSAVREASNGGDFLQRIKRHFDLDVRIISGREEARLIYLGVRHGTDMKGKRHLIIDIGGGSVEFIVADKKRALLLESKKLGAARMTAAHVKSDPISEKDYQALMQHYARDLEVICDHIRKLKPDRVIGTSGTLECIATMLHPPAATTRASSNGSSDDTPKPLVIERAALHELVEKLLKSDSAKRATIAGLDEARRDQIIAGVVLVGEIFKRLHIRRMQLCKSALREGILVDYLERHRPALAIRQQIPQPRLRSVIALARRCSWHRTHSEQVARLTVRLFDQLQNVHGLNTRQRELIEYGALLHDIGWHIGRDKHHKHSQYLIEHGGLKSFTPEEISIIANIARYHRKAEPKLKHPPYAKLSPTARKIVDVGAALLRVADGLDRSHSSVVRDVKCRPNEKDIKCVVTTKWDAQLEAWGAARKAKMFEKVFRRAINFEVVRG